MIATVALALAATTTSRVSPANLRIAQPRAPMTDYLTYHYDNARTGWNARERVLTRAAVSSASFGLQKVLTVDGNVYAQPLVATNVLFRRGERHDVLIVATENNSVYAFDANTDALLWHTNFNAPRRGIGPETSNDAECSQIAPVIGISSTPVIDRARRRVYVVAKTRQGTGSSATFANTIHALELESGREAVAASPIAGSVRLSNHKREPFDEHWHVNRPGLLEVNGTIYVGFGSSCDINPSFVHGWLFAFDAATLRRTGIFNTTTDVRPYYLGSIWQATYAPAADDAGNIYLVTGNGAFNAGRGGANYGDSVLRITPRLKVADFFTPFDQHELFDDDGDLGSGGIMLLPPQPGPVPDLAVTAGKQDAIYLLDRSHLGGYTPNGPNAVADEVPFTGRGVWGGPAYFRGERSAFVYYALNRDALKAYRVGTVGGPHLTLASSSANTFPGEGGTIPAVSSLGSREGIVWAIARPDNIQSDPLVLYAYDAGNLAHLLFKSGFGYWANGGGGPFLTPTIANGRVYVGGATSVSIFGT